MRSKAGEALKAVNFRALLGVGAAAFVLLFAQSAFAACVSPAGNAGDIAYGSTNNIMAYCNGASWVGMGPSNPVSFGTLTTGDFCTAVSGTQIACTTATVNLGTQAAGVLPSANGGTGVNNGASTIVLGGNLATSGAYNLTLTLTGATNVTLPTSGTLVDGGGTSNYVARWTGAVALGTGTLYDNGTDIAIGTTSPAASLDLSARTDALVLPVGTTGTRPAGAAGEIRYNSATPGVEAYIGGAWETFVASAGGVLGVPNGGTGDSVLGAHGVLIGEGTAAVNVTITGVAGQLLQAAGASADPTWTTAIYPGTTTADQLLYSSAANTVAGLATANNGVLVTSAAGVPSIASTLPSAVQGNITGLGTITSGTWDGTAIGVGYGGTGTGTTFTQGSVVFAGASGIYSQDNANFFWDGTNHRLGIGTSAPGGKLQVTTTSQGTDGITITNTSSSSMISLAPNLVAANWNYLVQAGDAALIYSGNGGKGTGAFVIAPWVAAYLPYGLRMDASGHMGLDVSSPLSALDVGGGVSIGTGYAGVVAAPSNGAIIQGAVGIGTTSPAAGTALDLSANTTSANSSLLLPVGTTGTRPTGVNGMLRYNSTVPTVEAYVNGAWESLGGGLSGMQYQVATFTGTNTASGNADILTDAGNDFIVTAGGLSIGTTAAAANQINLSGSAAQSMSMERGASTGNNLTLQAGGGLSGGTNENGGNLVLASGITTGTGTSNIAFNLYPAGASGTADNAALTALTVSATGLTGTTANTTLQANAGSGTNQNGGTLTLASGVSTGTGTSNIAFNVYGAGSTGTTPNAATTAMTIASNGKVGIGSASPADSLDLSQKTDGVSLPVAAAPAGSSCTGFPTGTIRYNTTIGNLEFCNGTVWQTVPVAATSCSAPSGLSFTNVTGASLGVIVTSNVATITFSGCSGSYSVSVSGASTAQISINGGAWVTSGTISSGQTLQVRLTSSSSASTMLTATVTVGSSSTNWTVTTRSGSLKIFSTSNTYIGTQIGGLSGADAICQSEAGTLGYAGTYKAIMSDDSTSAASRLTLSYPIVRASDGTTVSTTNLWVGSLSNPIVPYVYRSPNQTWTGTNSDGSASTGDTCSSWSASGTGGLQGDNQATSTQWLVYGWNVACSTAFYIYCIQQ